MTSPDQQATGGSQPGPTSHLVWSYPTRASLPFHVEFTIELEASFGICLSLLCWRTCSAVTSPDQQATGGPQPGLTSHLVWSYPTSASLPFHVEFTIQLEASFGICLSLLCWRTCSAVTSPDQQATGGPQPGPTSHLVWSYPTRASLPFHVEFTIELEASFGICLSLLCWRTCSAVTSPDQQATGGPQPGLTSHLVRSYPTRASLPFHVEFTIELEASFGICLSLLCWRTCSAVTSPDQQATGGPQPGPTSHLVRSFPTRASLPFHVEFTIELEASFGICLSLLCWRTCSAVTSPDQQATGGPQPGPTSHLVWSYPTRASLPFHVEFTIELEASFGICLSLLCWRTCSAVTSPDQQATGGPQPGPTSHLVWSYPTRASLPFHVEFTIELEASFGICLSLLCWRTCSAVTSPDQQATGGPQPGPTSHLVWSYPTRASPPFHVEFTIELEASFGICLSLLCWRTCSAVTSPDQQATGGPQPGPTSHLVWSFPTRASPPFHVEFTIELEARFGICLSLLCWRTCSAVTSPDQQATGGPQPGPTNHLVWSYPTRASPPFHVEFTIELEASFGICLSLLCWRTCSAVTSPDQQATGGPQPGPTSHLVWSYPTRASPPFHVEFTIELEASFGICLSLLCWRTCSAVTSPDQQATGGPQPGPTSHLVRSFPTRASLPFHVEFTIELEASFGICLSLQCWRACSSLTYHQLANFTLCAN